MTNHELLTLTRETLLKSAQLQARAIARARFVQAQIDELRRAIAGLHTYDTDQSAALLASYDAEMNRLCSLPGVLNALLGDEVTP